MKVQLPAIVQLHGAVLMFALAGLFAKWIDLDAFWLVLARTGFAALALLVFFALFKRSALHMDKKDRRRFFISGLLLAVHWLTFFLAIQYSTVTFGLLIFASFPLFTLILVAVLEHTKPSGEQLLQSALIVLGVLLLTIDNLGEQKSLFATALGLCSALTFAALLLVNKSLVRQYQPTTIACYQNMVAFICCLPLLIYYQQPAEVLIAELPLLILLGVVFTAISHSLLNSALSQLAAFSVGIAICLEPVYGAVAAVLLLDEQISLMMLVGGSIIVLVNGYQTVSKQ